MYRLSQSLAEIAAHRSSMSGAMCGQRLEPSSAPRALAPPALPPDRCLSAGSGKWVRVGDKEKSAG